MTTASENQPHHAGEAGLGYAEVARIAEEGAQRGLRFGDAETVEPYSDRRIVRLRAIDGTLYRVDSWSRWRALLEVLEPAR